jgi:NADPH-dependent 2,4-dienoyl-CoA reductase/sulfur reductase-like enzyme
MQSSPLAAANDDAPRVAGRRRAARRVALGLAVACTDLAGLVAEAAPASGGDRTVRTFVAFCDTLVPADALTPSASALGVPKEILGDLQGQPLGERLLAAGCDWLDQECRGDFAAAPEAMRDAALQKMQAMPWESPAGRFFLVMRNTVMADYYAQPLAWRGLALDRPPQPLGFFEAVR